jgi:enamine deaminase RidA (YjgF/YER057c/UK114 family)
MRRIRLAGQLAEPVSRYTGGAGAGRSRCIPGTMPAVNTVRRRYAGDARPASTLVEASALAIPNALVEIEAVAPLPSRDA